MLPGNKKRIASRTKGFNPVKIMIFGSPEGYTCMNQAYLLIGGNLGNREENIARARIEIDRICGTIIKASSLYETAAWGNTDQPDFLNQVLELATKKNAHALLTALLSIEEAMGRFRKDKYGPRLIDLDVLFFNEEIIETEILQVPHPRLQDRRFVLIPMAEMAADKIHPVLKKSMAELLAICPDQLAVNKYIPIVDNKR
jgi:2-amino-4-hydroxy-6-hydroxymethyldihydropteridine diphosphokinase